MKNMRICFKIPAWISVVALFILPGKVYGQSEVKLWPELRPFASGYLRVSDIHQIYYEVYGNPDGKPIFFLHGGPGGSSNPWMTRLADPKKFMMVLHDQRGTGQSLPQGEIEENTTQHLVDDIESLKNHLRVKQMILVGRSWGTTLALTYAQTYPQQVTGMVLWGIFLATKGEIDHIFHGGVAPFFPKVYQDFLNALPEPDVKDLPAYLFDWLHNGSDENKQKVANIWGTYTIKISMLELSQGQIKKILETWNPFLNAYFESYYMSHQAFLKENQLLINADKISHIPTVIMNGRYDLICPPQNAYKLHQALPRSELVIIERAGHSSDDPMIEKTLIKAIRSFEPRIISW